MNIINTITLYKWCDQWVFDDERVGLNKEALVLGTDKIIDYLVSNIPNAESGVLCLFSKYPIPEYTIKLVLSKRGDKENGNWYKADGLGMECWLCPALYLYFEEEPENIYCKILPIGL